MRTRKKTIVVRATTEEADALDAAIANYEYPGTKSDLVRRGIKLAIREAERNWKIDNTNYPAA